LAVVPVWASSNPTSFFPAVEVVLTQASTVRFVTVLSAYGVVVET
jgi:hypothetical protein